jgi:hypothetical protein
VNIGSSGASLATIPDVARNAWSRLRDELQALLGDDLVAIWAYGSTIGSDRPNRPADLDTHVILKGRPDARTAQRINNTSDAIAAESGVEFDVWFIALEDARQPDHPPHAFRDDRRDTSWALHRAHWLAGRFGLIHGLKPAELVPSPTWPEILVDLDRELEHIERHAAEGDTDPYEAAYAILNGSRILHSLETHDVVLSKREAGTWALDHLPDRWHPAIHAALRAYDEQATPDDEALLADEMGAFVAMVRKQLPFADQPSLDRQPRWAGY